jgi:hypothetical protein
MPSLPRPSGTRRGWPTRRATSTGSSDGDDAAPAPLLELTDEERRPPSARSATSSCKNYNHIAARAGFPGRNRGDSELPASFKAEGTLAVSGDEDIYWTFEVKEGRPWTFDFDDCLRYLKTPVDSCSCGDETGKRVAMARTTVCGCLTE